jgi:hypothetical protein
MDHSGNKEHQMERSLAELESIVRNRICSVCSDRTVEGNCGLEQPSGCTLFELFPRVAKAILAVKSDDIHDYIEAIRRDVCPACLDQARDGSCDKRQQVRCALDAYLLLVVDAIEEATGRSFDRTKLGGSGDAPVRLSPEIRL